MPMKLLLYDPITKKKFRPIIKFNGGRGAILCRKCRKVIKENLTLDEFKGHVENIFCVDCAWELLMKLFKRPQDVQGERTHQDD